MRELDVFDIARKPNPYVEVKMRGGKSGLLIEGWSHVAFGLVLTYARILAAEPEGVLEVKNIDNEVVKFSALDGWVSFEARICGHAHLA